MQPLSGVLVVAVEQAVAAPICTRHLGDLGARVVKVENRAGGDFARSYDEVVRGKGCTYKALQWPDDGVLDLICGEKSVKSDITPLECFVELA